MMIYLETLEAMYTSLETIKGGDILSRNTGLCDNLSSTIQKVYPNIMGDGLIWTIFDYVLDDAFKNWNEFSGNISYPIKAPAGERNKNSRTLYTETNDKWDLDTEYGKARYALLDYTYHYIQKKYAQLYVVSTAYDILTDMADMTDIPNEGICNNIYNDDRMSHKRIGHTPLRIYIRTILYNAFKLWPKYSGSGTYPVPASYPFGDSPKDDVYRAANDSYMNGVVYGKSGWDKSTEYGQLRHELLAFLIEHFKEKLSPIADDRIRIEWADGNLDEYLDDLFIIG